MTAFLSEFQTDLGPRTLVFQNGREFRRICGQQSAVREDTSIEDFQHWFNTYHRMLWHRRWGQGIYQVRDPGPRLQITDIGSGVGVWDLMTALYRSDTDFHLIDGDRMSIRREDPTWTQQGTVIYNRWQVLRDGIESSGLDPGRFQINTDNHEPWPDSDIICSFFSWCFHYSTDVYLEQVLRSLKPGGRLYLTVRAVAEDPSIERISRALGVRPTVINTYDRSSRATHLPILDESKDWFYADCVWQRPGTR